MPTRPVIILHGWSDNSSSFAVLARWLKSKGFDAVDIFLGDYISMHDEITLADLGFAFSRALEANAIPRIRHSFDLVVHSTGGLVALEYLRQACRNGDSRDASLTPVRNLCFLAPANFGSPLAQKGKSVIGRTLKGWSWDRLLKTPERLSQTGRRVLDALELAAPYSSQLGLDTLFDRNFPVLDSAHVRATVMVGSAPYTGIARFTHEAGGDGTVRVATANLNAHHYRLDFSEPDSPAVEKIPRNFDRVAFAVFNRNHGSICKPAPDKDDRVLDQIPEWEATLLRALSLEDAAEYDAHLSACDALTKATFAGKADDPNFHRYMHVVFRVHDQFGEPVPDYVVDFFQPKGDPQDKIYGAINSQILEKVTANTTAPEYRSFFFDITDLETFLGGNPSADITMSIAAAPVSADIAYRNPSATSRGISVFSTEERDFIHPDEPVLVDITLCRDPSSSVFKLARFQ